MVDPRIYEMFCEIGRDLYEANMISSHGGNLSIRLGDRVIIKRRGAQLGRLKPHDLTGGFKAWRASTLSAIPFEGIHAGGYVFQIEMTYRASRSGARIREVPITFRDRQAGKSKMSRKIVAEALIVVVQLRLGSLRAAGRHA